MAGVTRPDAVTTFVQHRAVTPGGKVLLYVTMTNYERWMPYAALDLSTGLGSYAAEHALETRVLPDGEWEPAVVVRQPGRQPIVISRGTL